MKKYIYVSLCMMIVAAAIIGYVKYDVLMSQYHRFTQGNMLSGMMMQQTGSVSVTGVSIHQSDTVSHKKEIAGELTKLTKQTRVLLEQYQKKKDSQTLFELVQSLEEDGAYYTALSLYQILLRDYPHKANYKDYLTLLINRGDYTTGFLSEYQYTINTLAASGTITSQDQLFFTSFRSLIAGDIDTFYQVVRQLSGDYAPLAGDLIANFNTHAQYKQAPQQYLWGLFASTLLRYGYYSPAIHLAQQSLKFNPNYVLGLQVMSYAHLMTHDWNIAKSYLVKLMNTDSSHLLTYQRLYGIASYWSEEYRDTIQYLTQVYEKVPTIELLRYMGLSYRSLYDYLHVTKIYRSILNDTGAVATDYFEFFDTYRRAVSYSSGMSMTGIVNPVDEHDQRLLRDYVIKCKTTLTGDTAYLCIYGDSLQKLFASNITGSLDQMLDISRTYPYDFIYGMIGDIYSIMNNLPTAQIYYQKAIDSSYNGGYQRYLSNKIKSFASNGS